MIIEDNEKIRNELCDFLGKNGYEALGPDDLSIPWISFIRSSRICFYWI